jgi:hemerythrin-like domain-containing protein
MDVTDALVGEHGVLHLLLEQLEDAAGRCATVAELRIACEPFAISLLGHHRAEEATLLTPYERQTGSLGPLKCLRHEHQLLDELIRGLFKSDDVAAMRAAVATLTDHVRRHLAREEQLLFQHVRQTLPAGDREHLAEHWAEFRGMTLPK